MSEQQVMNWGVCDHLRIEEVKTESGKTLAYRCQGCAKILCHHGKCSGCRRIGKITVFNRRDKRGFCDERCETRAMSRERKAKNAAKKAASTVKL